MRRLKHLHIRYRLSFDSYQILFRNLLVQGLFRNCQIQNAVSVVGFNVAFLDIFTYVEAPRHGSGVPLLTDQFAFLVFISVKVLGCAYRDVAVIQFYCDVLLLEARKIY